MSASGGQGTRLAAVAIPPRLRGFAAAPHAQAFDVMLDGARIASIAPTQAPARGLLLPAMVDAHAHIDKNYTVREVGPAAGNLFAAIERMAARRAHWDRAAIHARMERALGEAWRAGTRALRTHLDWVQPEEPAALPAFEALRAAWAGRVELQFAALTPLDLLADAAAGERIAGAVRRAGGVLGAFVYRNDQLVPKLSRVFDLAQHHGLALDFHVDEGLDADATALREIATLAIERGLRDRVVCGHACSLSVQGEDAARDTLALCAEAGLHLVALPTTNLYLQGAWDCTPVPRGITRLREAAAAGLRPSMATDNVQDAFYPYGGYDLVEVFGLGVAVAHLSPATDWLDAITVSPARALGLAWDGLLTPGCPADLVLLSATDEYELLDARGRHRTVFRAGRPLQ